MKRLLPCLKYFCSGLLDSDLYLGYQKPSIQPEQQMNMWFPGGPVSAPHKKDPPCPSLFSSTLNQHHVLLCTPRRLLCSQGSQRSHRWCIHFTKDVRILRVLFSYALINLCSSTSFGLNGSGCPPGSTSSSSKDSRFGSFIY